MAKKQQFIKSFSPELYIQQEIHTLPVGDCYLSENWQESGKALALVTRCHAKGTYTLGSFLVDTFCRGVVQCTHYFNIGPSVYKDMINLFQDQNRMIKVSYEEVHDFIYGAIAFAKEGGIEPDSSFLQEQYILKEDTDEVPSIDYKFGKNGKHLLIAHSYLELMAYYSRLRSTLGDDFLYWLPEMREPQKANENIPPQLKDMVSNVWEHLENKPYVTEEAYSYIHPDYPVGLSVQHDWIVSLLYNPEYADRLPDELIWKILDLPHDELKTDLEQIVLFETRNASAKVALEHDEAECGSAFMHCIILLGELRVADSLSVILETLRQNEAFYDFYVGERMEEVFVPTLYLLGRDHLEQLMDYMQTPGLYTYARLCVVEAMAQVVYHHPERRSEVIGWFRQLLDFYKGKLEKQYCCDGTLVGLITATLMNLRASELLPELKVLYDTGLVDEECAGDFRTVSREITAYDFMDTVYDLDIHKRYANLARH